MSRLLLCAITTVLLKNKSIDIYALKSYHINLFKTYLIDAVIIDYLVKRPFS